MSRYGQGNAHAIMRIRAQNRRLAAYVRTVDARDVGVRPELGRVVGLDGRELEGPPAHDPTTCSVFGCHDCRGPEAA